MTSNSASHELPGLLQELARFSAPGSGVTRLAYDEAWCAAHAWLAEQGAARGLAAAPDAAGGLWFSAPGAPRRALLVGSHLDSVPGGGRYDGAYGVLAGLLLARGAAAPGELPVVGFVSPEEEESRFRGGLMGARSLVGQVRAAELDAIRDLEGVTWRAALERARACGCAAALAPGERPFAPPFEAAAQLELHIEQGPVLEAEGLHLGIVEGIAGYRRAEVRVSGEARHAGTTPMLLRRDALAAAAECALAAEALAREAGEPAVATAGRLGAEPGAFNVVPGWSELWLEVRHAEAAALARLAAELEARCRAICERRGVSLEWRDVSSQEPVRLSEELAGLAEALARERGVQFRRMVSGAGHDTMVFARHGVPSLMLFVPSRGGVSHSPEEYTPAQDLSAGVEFARELCARIARGKWARADRA